MKHHRLIGLGLLVVLLVVGFVGCGFDKYDMHFGLGAKADDGVKTDTDLDQLKDGVLPPEPTAPKKPKKGESEEKKPSAKDG